ncbi:hypothetical protein BN168_650040 [Clostridioides difficile CD002]|nr:hypothetical protein QG7_3306 [Clostridioides difficile CD175]EQK28521.1 hypothetical protein QW3_3336 [Clostridioides difficile P74]CCL03608.1 hypothetical protein BN167_1890035 [Clostridioides difficile E13]CCL08590.1 hypothetical protein BN168_650040 [Clostridioides difficile CD002]
MLTVIQSLQLIKKRNEMNCKIQRSRAFSIVCSTYEEVYKIILLLNNNLNFGG